MADACGFYGRESVVTHRLMDVEGMLGERERAECQEWIGAFGRRFPQLFLLVYLGPLPPPASPRQFAFWLLNHAAVPDAEALQPNERGLLLVVNPKAGSAVLTGGYFIENLLSQGELDWILRSGAKAFGRGEWAAGLGAVVSDLSALLKKKAREANRNPQRFQAPAPAEWNGSPAFPPLVRTGEGTGMDFAAEPARAGEEWAAPQGLLGAMDLSGGAESGRLARPSERDAAGFADGADVAQSESEAEAGREEAAAEAGAGSAGKGGGREGGKGKKSGTPAPGRTTRMVRALSGGKRQNPKRR